jgi:hypothetical protein
MKTATETTYDKFLEYQENSFHYFDWGRSSKS